MIAPYLFAKAVSDSTYFNMRDFLKIQQRLQEGEKLFSFELRKEFPNLEMILCRDKKYWYEVEKSFYESLKKNIFWLYPGHDLYPKQFINLNEPAWLIRFQGSPIWLTKQGFSIVGSREPSISSLQWMEEQLPAVMKALSLYIVSGGARGVDYKAHLLALRNRCPTLVVVPAGLGSLYPESMKDWAEEVLAQGGALMSEYDNHQSMQKHFFLARNRLIAALGVAVLIVEARLKSGTLITARQAIEQGQPLMVLPSHPNDVKARGGLNLISEGALMVRDAMDMAVCLNSELNRFHELEQLATSWLTYH